MVERDGLRVKLFGADRGRVLNVMQRRRKKGDRWEGFSDWSTQEIVAVTGLDPQAAEFAQERLATEPFLWRDTEEKLKTFSAALEEEGIRLVKGGRFWCAMGRFDKADAARWLTSLYHAAQPGTEVTTVALGDSPNDLGMLAAADIAVVIRSTNTEEMELPNHSRVIRTQGFGPEGWQEAITAILQEQETE